MNVALSEEQRELSRTVRAFLEQKSPEAEVRRLMETDEGFDRGVWDQMAAQLGLQGLAIPEEYGGSGYTFRELAIVLEEMGRVLMCTPFLSTAVLAGYALLESGDTEAQARYLPGIASGAIVASLALAEDTGGWTESAVTVAASGADSGWTLTGVKSFVLDGRSADLILVAARAPKGTSLFAVSGDAPGLTRRPLSTMDLTRKLARLEFRAVPAILVGAEGEAWPGLERTLQLAAVALAAEQVGGAQRCMEMSVEYAQNRIQFWRAIGSFQAVKHRCADMLVQVEMAKSAAYYAAACAASDDVDLPVAAAMAKSYCSEAYYKIAAETIQVHGGIGFTWEHPAHLYLKRAKSSELFLGDPREHRRRLASALQLN
ncbi:MAG TPA: acyl-CoA dehydrogenase family protein [Solirubrobacteraceae bacterium]|nr:acyl-CoA dehydrogenase family protein [Solirubrobacteraceae bacterium]